MTSRLRTRFEQSYVPFQTPRRAVRLEDWELAWSATQRYLAVEPDRREAERLRNWVALRQQDAGVPRESVCSHVGDPPPIRPNGY